MSKKSSVETKKETNPKDAVGVQKVPFSVLSMQVLGEMGLGMLEGARKYGRHNYRVTGVRASVYFDAAMRHLVDWYEGQDIDPTSGLHHLTKLLTTMMVLRDGMLQENWVDDRPPKARNQHWVDAQNQAAADIIQRFPVPVPAFTQVEQQSKNNKS